MIQRCPMDDCRSADCYDCYGLIGTKAVLTCGNCGCVFKGKKICKPGRPKGQRRADLERQAAEGQG